MLSQANSTGLVGREAIRESDNYFISQHLIKFVTHNI